jgi:hypothetical protein
VIHVRNSRLGLLSILLAAASVAAYLVSIITGVNLDFLGKFGAVLGSAFQLGTVASLLVGIAAVLRARRGAGGFSLTVAGLILGGTLTLLWTAWIGMLMLNPRALG